MPVAVLAQGARPLRFIPQKPVNRFSHAGFHNQLRFGGLIQKQDRLLQPWTGHSRFAARDSRLSAKRCPEQRHLFALHGINRAEEARQLDHRPKRQFDPARMKELPTGLLRWTIKWNCIARPPFKRSARWLAAERSEAGRGAGFTHDCLRSPSALR